MKRDLSEKTDGCDKEGIHLFEGLKDKEDRRYVIAVMRQVVNKQRKKYHNNGGGQPRVSGC